MYAVCVTFQIKPDQMEAFLPKMRENATATLRDEPDCHQFDICVDGTEVFLYELYSDAAAFQTHLQTAHFKRFDAEVAEMIADKHVRLFDDHWAPDV